MKEIFDQIAKFILEHFKVMHLIFLVFLFIVFVIIVSCISRDFQKKNSYLHQLIANKNNLIHLKIDLLNKSVYIFSNKDLKNAKQIPLKDFFNSYEERDALNLNRWFMNQLNNKISESNTKEILLNTKSKKYAAKNIFLCTLINFETSTIYVDWYHSVYPNYVKADYEIERYFFKLNKKSVVDIGIISFFALEEKLHKENDVINSIHLQQIIESITKLSDNHHLITILKNGDIGILVLHEKDCLPYLEKIKEKINIYLDTNNLNISFNIAMFKNIGNKINYSDCLKKVKTVANYLMEKENHLSEIHYFDPKASYSSHEANEKAEKIKNSIIHDKFLPAISTFFYAKDGKTAFYLYELKTKNNEFTSNEIKKCIYHNSLQNNYSEIFHKHLDESFKHLITDKTTITIMVKTTIWLIESFLEDIEKVNHLQDYEFILCFSNLNFETNFDDNNLKILKLLKEKHITICLEMNSLNMPRQEVLSLIDYVLFDISFISEHYNNNQSTLLLRNLFNDFKKLKFSVISSNLDDWNSLESMFSNNAIIFSTKFLENDFKQNIGLNKKTINKLKGIYNKYH